MDEMKFELPWTTAIVSKLVKRGIRKSLGYNIDVQLNKFRTTIIEEKTHVHLDVDLELTKEEFDKLMERIGL